MNFRKTEQQNSSKKHYLSNKVAFWVYVSCFPKHSLIYPSPDLFFSLREQAFRRTLFATF